MQKREHSAVTFQLLVYGWWRRRTRRPNRAYAVNPIGLGNLWSFTDSFQLPWVCHSGHSRTKPWKQIGNALHCAKIAPHWISEEVGGEATWISVAEKRNIPGHQVKRWWFIQSHPLGFYRFLKSLEDVDFVVLKSLMVRLQYTTLRKQSEFTIVST